MAKAKSTSKTKHHAKPTGDLHSSGDILERSAKPKPLVIILIVAVLIAIGIFAVYRSFAASDSMTLLPASSNVSLGTSFTVAIHENSGSDAVNAAEADLTYDSTKLQFVSIDGSTSGFSQAATASGATAGKVQVARFAATTSGTATTVTGDQLIANVTFMAIGTGTTNVGITACTTATGCAVNTSAVIRASDSNNVLTITTGSTFTIADTTPPSVPAGLTAGTRTVNSIAFSWTAATDNVGVTGYKVLRNGTVINSNVATNSFTDTGLTPGTNYSYTVQAFDAAGNVSASSTALATSTLPDTTAPSVPTGLAAGTRTVTTIPLTWTASTDNVGVTGYNILRNGTKVGTSATPSYTDTGLTPGTNYSYTVQAFDAAANTSASSTALAASTLADTTAPSVPAGLITPSQTTNTIVLNWTASTDNVAVTGYNILRNGTKVGTSATNSYTDTALSQGTAYTYAIQAYDAAGNTSASSATSNFSTKSKPGDVNSDGFVNITDLSILAAHYGQSGQVLATGDLNGDGVVNIFDLSILAANFGT